MQPIEGEKGGGAGVHSSEKKGEGRQKELYPMGRAEGKEKILTLNLCAKIVVFRSNEEGRRKGGKFKFFGGDEKGER